MLINTVFEHSFPQWQRSQNIFGFALQSCFIKELKLVLFVLQHRTDKKKKMRGKKKKKENRWLILNLDITSSGEDDGFEHGGKHESRTSGLGFLSIFSSSLAWFVVVFFSKQVNTQTKKDHFSSQYQVYQREKSIKSADIKNQLLICPSLLPVREQLGELAAQAQTSPWDLNTEALTWRTNKCHVEHNIYLKHCKTDTMIQKAPRSQHFGALSVDFSAWF